MWKLELFGLFIHFFLLISIFDIHLKHEIHQGDYQKCSNAPLAKRLVLIIANGLDGEATYDLIKSNPDLIDQMQIKVWGKTEKNNLMKINGITALTGGFERNPRPLSSIYNSDKTEYDSIFNYVSKTIYAGNQENLDHFGSTSKTWEKLIIDQNNRTNIKQFLDKFKDEIKKKEMENIVHENNVIIFISLPRIKYEEESQTNTIYRLMKNDVYGIIEAMEDFYGDRETSYIICSDNSEFSNDDKTDEIFIMTGKGVNERGEIMINMKDLCLMASILLGNPLPRSSTGKLHTSILGLNKTEETSMRACNAIHLSSIANRTLQQVGNKFMEAIRMSSDSDSRILEFYKKKILTIKNNTNDSELNALSEELTHLSLKIAEKDVTFMKTMIFYLTHSLFLGWIITLLIQLILFLIKKHPDQEMRIQILRKKTELWFFGMHTLLILLGTISVLFIIVKDWPLHYIFYWLITLSLWGYVLGNLQTWTGLMDNLNFEKFIIIILYVIIYGVACESFIWGLRYKIILCASILIITMYSWVKSYITKKSLSIKSSTFLTGLILATSILLPTIKSQNAILVLLTGILLPIMSVICAYNMRYDAFDFFIMTITIFLSCISLIITCFKLYHPTKTLDIVSWALFASCILFPVFGGIDNTKRLQLTAVCFGCSMILISTGYEPLTIIVVFMFSFSWYLNDKPQHKTKFLNRYNSFQVVIFAMLVFAIMHMIGSLDNSKNYLSLTWNILEKVKLLLALLVVLTTFNALKHLNGGDSQFVISLIIIHYCGYRLFLDLKFPENMNSSSAHFSAYCNVQIAMIILLLTHSFSKFLLYASILNFKKCLGELFERIFNSRL